MLGVKKEALIMAGRAWKTTQWAWAVEGVVALEDGAALEEVKGAERADLVQTERTTKEQSAGKSPRLHL